MTQIRNGRGGLADRKLGRGGDWGAVGSCVKYYVSKASQCCDGGASLREDKKKQFLGASAESRSLTLRKRQDLAVELAQLHDSQWGDLRGRLDIQHAAVAGRRPLVFAVRKAAGSGGNWRRWRCWCSLVGCDDIVQLNTAGACLIRMDQVERHGGLAVHLLVALSRSQWPKVGRAVGEVAVVRFDAPKAELVD